MTGPALTRRTLLLCLALAACATPEPDYYRLAAPPGPSFSTGDVTVELRRIGLPGYLDRPEIVRAAPEGRLDVLGGARWAEPLDRMIGRAVTGALMQRLPSATLALEGSALSIQADLFLEMEVRRFEATDRGTVEFEAQIGLLRADGDGRAIRVVQSSVPLDGTDVQAQVAAMSHALGRAADEIAGLIAAEGFPSAPPRA